MPPYGNECGALVLYSLYTEVYQCAITSDTGPAAAPR
jgi:hypothetical protein